MDHAEMQLITETTPAIGAFRNEWRQRQVVIYADPSDPTMVITKGVPWSGGPAILTHEPLGVYASYIGTFYKVYQ